MTACQQAAHQADAGPQYKPRQCLKATRECFDVDAHDFTPDNGRDPLAREAWQFAKFKHRVGTSATDRAQIPSNVPGFFSDPKDPHGAWHAVVMCGGNRCRSVDIKRSGYLDQVTVETIERDWGLVFLGWTEDLNTVRVYHLPAPVLSRGKNIDSAIAALERAAKANAKAPVRLGHVKAALRELRQIKAV